MIIQDPILGITVRYCSFQGKPNSVDFHKVDEGATEISSCPFCNFKGEILYANGQAFVIANKWPTVESAERHLIMVESPTHSVTLRKFNPEKLAAVFMLFRDIFQDNTKYAIAQIFRNEGEDAGASLRHSHSQIKLVNYVPWHIQREEKHFSEQRECHFCRTQVGYSVFESHLFKVWCPFASRPFETWILPKAHRTHFHEASDLELCDLAGTIIELLRRYQCIRFLRAMPYNLVFFTPSFRNDGRYHYRIALIPRVTKIGGLENALPGEIVNAFFPDEVAKMLSGQDP